MLPPIGLAKRTTLKINTLFRLRPETKGRWMPRQRTPRNKEKKVNFHPALYTLKCHTCVFSSGGFMPIEI